MMLIVGLGNPGEKYENTYHNMGFCVVDRLAERLSLKFKGGECQAEIAEGNISGEKLRIAKPQTYMNLSGESVHSIMQKYKIEMKDVLIIYDDIDLPQGAVRVRANGSAGTHNGMRNIVALCGELPRLRVGIGRPQEGRDLADYVLSKVPTNSKSVIGETIDKVIDALENYLSNKDISALARALN